MNGCISIDFKPGSHAAPMILQAIDTLGYDLCGLHLVPSCPERWTLMIDLGWIGREEVEQVERTLDRIAGVICVIHLASAKGVRAEPIAAAPIAYVAA
jgi:hypothetical protein